MPLNIRSSYSPESMVIKEDMPPNFTDFNLLSCRLGKYCRYLYLRLRRLRGTPHSIARGLACGVFVGCFPLFGLQTIMGVLLAVIFRGNKFAAAIGTWISNPLTYVPIFAFNYKVGKLLLLRFQNTVLQIDFRQSWQSWSTLIESGFDFTLTLFLGCFIVGAFCSFISYFLSLKVFFRQK
ncbi:MAG: DUF2062 domain-containing protein [cyanobacterium endosymbiont of Rhopalodia musculus]|uniref:DUF2062 domain-containing protein n=1 Tax=cyanobacterium endosymbiont of Epithemia clementina EcSB TaxID=3034674 RepID=UPI00247FB4B6|nr:DUF2062 domain-containing protein [cyanobacterium endosymbiont of Epithemia clementina EcSB]WGT67697.1 DUF2062 domain-containing protein [cyanobacterium endosymbiont of Epithemia clementina EcSB]